MPLKLSKTGRTINTNFLNTKKSTNFKTVTKKLPNGKEITGKVPSEQRIIIGKNARNLEMRKTPRDILLENTIKEGKFNSSSFNNLKPKEMSSLLNKLGVTKGNFETTFLSKLEALQKELERHTNSYNSKGRPLIVAEVPFFRMCETLGLSLGDTIRYYQRYSGKLLHNKGGDILEFQNLIKGLQKGGIKTHLKDIRNY
jgi:hypothetical protein